MNETCPWCGAGKIATDIESHRRYECDTSGWIERDGSPRYDQSEDCKSQLIGILQDKLAYAVNAMRDARGFFIDKSPPGWDRDLELLIQPEREWRNSK